ncbi:MAG: ABC transporter ATP-binding protein [Chitinophagales bacterium]|nr:ABC transporter ATP-binding protein [Chitinophagales bacterium]
MLQIVNVKKFYGSYLALQVSSLTISDGIHWLQGINGSGKTTFLKIIAGLLPFSGDIFIRDTISIKKKPVAYRRLVNYAEAEPLYPSFLSGTDLINLFVKAKQGTHQQADELIELLHVNSFISHPIGTYSSGMQKKMSIILALIGHPSLVLLDEPLVTVDDASVNIIYELIENYHRSKGTSFLLTSHQQFDQSRFTIENRFLVENQMIKHL